jgi:hypothetical protein
VEQSLSIVRQDECAGENEVSILFADGDDRFVDLFEPELRAGCSGTLLRMARCGDASQLMDIAGSGRFDLAIVTLNNIFGIGPSADERLRVMLKLIRHLKDSYRFPIIALSGYYDADDLPERALQAGADVFRDRGDTADLSDLVRLYLARDRPDVSWTNKEAP